MELTKGSTVINTRTGDCGIVASVWLNAWTEQYVVNVRVDGMQASWHINDVAEIETLPALSEAVAVLDEVLVTSDGNDQIHAVILTVHADTVFVVLPDYDEYVTLDKRSIVRNLTRQTEKAA